MAKKVVPNFPSDKPDIKPAQPKKDFDKWFMSGFGLSQDKFNNMNMTVLWCLGRTYKEAGVEKIELSEKARSFAFNDVLSDDFEAKNPELAPMLAAILPAVEAICKRQGGLNA